MKSKASSTSPRSEAGDVLGLIRSALHLAGLRGHSADRLCRGLGFSLDDLRGSELRISYGQAARLIRRVRTALRDPALGLSSGSRQTLTSLGLPGLAMLTCRTLREALGSAACDQLERETLLGQSRRVIGEEFIVEAVPSAADQDLVRHFVEEAFSRMVAMTRDLVGTEYAPDMVELAFPRPSYADAYAQTFGCPIRFAMPANRLVSDACWLDRILPSYDQFNSPVLRTKVETLMSSCHLGSRPNESSPLTSQLRRVEHRARDEAVRPSEVSKRTLRRRLTA